jgi:hypothetical protein
MSKSKNKEILSSNQICVMCDSWIIGDILNKNWEGYSFYVIIHPNGDITVCINDRTLSLDSFDIPKDDKERTDYIVSCVGEFILDNKII